ncbi:MAG: iron-containing alcohol dehydrogenase [Clostridia bacterium]|nr:iron-containing alcohol dehydrogenase [Clostridia bacterium]
MLNFEFTLPTKFLFGRGTESLAGQELKAVGGTRALIHYGGGSAVRSGLLDRVTKSLDEAGVEYVLLGGAVPNPRDSKVYEGIALVRKEKCDCILAVGGGSAIDSAKAIAHGSVYDGDFWDLWSGKAPVTKTLPLGCVLTLSATGSESSNSSVIMQEKTKLKRGLNTPLNRPLFAIMNPELTFTLPPYQVACGATDIMAHIMERYFTNEKEVAVTDHLCEALLKTVIQFAPIAYKDPTNYDAQAQLMWTGTLAHNNTCGVGREGDWASHQIEHELSAMYDVAHGAGLAVVFPAWMRYNLDHDVNRFAQFAVNVYGVEMNFDNPRETALRGIERHEAFLKSIGMPLTFKELGAKTEDIPAMAKNVKRGPDGKTGQFVKLDTKEIEEIFRIADR